MATFANEYVFSAPLTDELKREIQDRTQEQLTEMLGVEVDTVMAEYVVVMIGNKKSLEQIAHDLVDFIGDEHAQQFVQWLGTFLPTREDSAAAMEDAGEPNANDDDLAPSEHQEEKVQPQTTSKSSEPRVISLKSSTTTAKTNEKRVISLGGKTGGGGSSSSGKGTVRSLNRSDDDVREMLARRSQRFGVQTASKLATASKTLPPRGRGDSVDAKDKEAAGRGGKKRKPDVERPERRANGAGGGRVTQLLGPPVNVDQAELDARDSLQSGKRQKTTPRGNDRGQENERDPDGRRGSSRDRRRSDSDRSSRSGGKDAPPLPSSPPSGQTDRDGRGGRGGRGGNGFHGQPGGFPGGPPGYGGFHPPPYGHPMYYPPPYGGMPPYGMGYPPHQGGMPPRGGMYMQPPMPPGPPRPHFHQQAPRGPRQPFQHRTWVNPNVAKAEGETPAGEDSTPGSTTTGAGSTSTPTGEPSADGSAPATGMSGGAGAMNAKAPPFQPRNPFHSSQMRPRFQNKTWVRPDTAQEEATLSTSLPKTPPQEELENASAQ